MPLQLELGLQVIRSYKRLSYTPWHAIAELVDNSTQSYLDNRDEIDHALGESEEEFTVGIVYDVKDDFLRISDNAMGMSYDDLILALRVGEPPADTSGRSKYGMGMKTSSCWIGNKWTIRTKKLGETTEHTVSINVESVADGENELPHTSKQEISADLHYTVIEIREHNRKFHGRTQGKIKDFLRSMYRQDLRESRVRIEWMGSHLEWEDGKEFQYLKAPDGTEYRKDFQFDVGSKNVHGWVGVLDRGSRAKAGFSILNANRVVKGWPESWRPESIYGQIQGSNDLINQRVIGEINLDSFQVSHTKDDILWMGDEEEEVQQLLKEHCSDYIEVARTRRRSRDDGRGPSDIETQAAIDELAIELESTELKDIVSLEPVPPEEVVQQAFTSLTASVGGREPTFQAALPSFDVVGYLVTDVSVNDPYIVVDSTSEKRLMVVINTQHPHWLQLQGSEGVLNYLRHCTYDGIAEWQARHQASRLDPDTIKLLKDKLLRLPIDIDLEQSQ